MNPSVELGDYVVVLECYQEDMAAVVGRAGIVIAKWSGATECLVGVAVGDGSQWTPNTWRDMTSALDWQYRGEWTRAQEWRLATPEEIAQARLASLGAEDAL